MPDLSAARLARAAARVWVRLLDLLHAPMRRDHRDDPFHQRFPKFVDAVNGTPAATVLELGSRNVSGALRRGHFPAAGRYIGCDIHPGQGVDLVVDAHRLSEAVAAGSVDAVFSISVFEHLAFPWKAALEINRVLKPGGLVFVSSHPAWPAHELPWDFWRFMSAGLRSLFNPETGFEIVEVVEGLPLKAYPLVDDPPLKGLHAFRLHGGVAILARKTADYDPARLRWDIDLDRAVGGMYPAPRP